MTIFKCRQYLWIGLIALSFLGLSPGECQSQTRDLIRIPDILEYKTLKCDFHIHTVFSDGNVWPTIRPMEAWMNGLDAIAMTDHIEYTPHKNDVVLDFNRSFEIAQPVARELHVTIIRGAEITRDMPPGHMNAMFIKDASALNVAEWRDAVKAAADQGAFIFWNHPGWTGQQPDGIAKWYDEHTELVEKGLVKGIEVVNGDEYYPEVHQWCLDKQLTMLGNSDIHDPIAMSYDPQQGQRRPMTLVFAKENTAESIHEALLDRRTAVYFRDWLIGEERFLRPIFEQSIALDFTQMTLKGKARHSVELANLSGLDYELELDGGFDELILPKKISLSAGKAILLNVRSAVETLDETKNFELPYRVTNLKVHPNEGLSVRLPITVTFVPKSS